MSSNRRHLSVRGAYHEHTTETFKKLGQLFQCEICLENNTRRYMDCCECKYEDQQGKQVKSNYICSACWYGWFGTQHNLNCPFPHCREKLFSEPLRETDGHRSIKSVKCSCCQRTTHLDESSFSTALGNSIQVHGSLPEGFPIEEVTRRIKDMVESIPTSGVQGGMIQGVMGVNR